MIRGRKITLGSFTSANPQEMKIGGRTGRRGSLGRNTNHKSHYGADRSDACIYKDGVRNLAHAAVVATALKGPATRAIMMQVKMTIKTPGRDKD